ncbi:MAG: M23 family metallopeptidase, partial [Flavobacteriales bacterium]
LKLRFALFMMANRLVWIKLLGALCFAPLQGNAQLPKNYFHAPLDIPLFLAGNFGEIRSNHFHAGLDIKTGGKEGKVVHPAAGGYVSRIKVSAFGYGKVLYIAHPNGYTTVYAHLKEFCGPIADYVKKLQYKRESWEIELFPDSGMFPVKISDTIAFSGNSGGSLAPHLHFEIRDSKDQAPLNGLMFGFDIKDNIPPVISRIAVYPLTETSAVNGLHEPLFLSITGSAGKYRLASTEKISVQGSVGFGIEVFDRLSQIKNKCGVYSIEMYLDSRLHYKHLIERIPFYETRFINSHLDYKAYKKDRREIQKCFVQPNNHLSIYQKSIQRGAIVLNDSVNHKMTFVVSDTYRNSSRISFVISASLNHDRAPSDTSVKALFKYKENNHFETDDIRIDIPASLLYEDLEFHYSLSDTLAGALAPVHRIQDIFTPIHSYMRVSIRVDGVDEKRPDKLLAVALNEDFKIIAAEGGHYDNGFVTFKTRSFGPYTVFYDTIPPRISPVNIRKGAALSGARSIDVKITDNLSGIKYYRGTIDGKWILMAYEPKKALLSYAFDGGFKNGKEHIFRLIVRDERGNQNEFSAKFTR